MFNPSDILTLTAFLRNAKAHVKNMKKTGRPFLFTVNGKAALVMHAVGNYQKLRSVKKTKTKGRGRS